MGKCYNCGFIINDKKCLLDGKMKDDVELCIDKDDCTTLQSYNVSNERTKVVTFDCEIKSDDNSYSAKISKDKNKLVIDFKGRIPLPILSKSEFHVKISIPESVGCINDCDKCITPIC